jgi:hypothetical protein
MSISEFEWVGVTEALAPPTRSRLAALALAGLPTSGRQERTTAWRERVGVLKRGQQENSITRSERLMSSAQAAALPAGFPAMSIAQAHQLLISTAGSPFEIEEREIRGVRIKTWKNAPPTLKDVSELNRPFGPRMYIVLDNERVTFDAHRAAVGHLAKRLVEDGVKKGDRVAIIMRNLPEWSVAFWAAAVIGAIVTPLNAWWTGPELEYGLVDSGSKIAIMDAERWERVREHAIIARRSSAFMSAVRATRSPTRASNVWRSASVRRIRGAS